LGDDLDEAQFVAATDRVAEYLYRDSVTAFGPVVARCRAVGRNARQGTAGVRFRSLGICPVGAGGAALIDAAVELLGRAVINRWNGEPFDPLLMRLINDANEVTARGSRRPATSVGPDLERLTQDVCKMLELELPLLRQRVDGLSETVLGTNVTAYFTAWVQQQVLDQEVRLSDDSTAPVDRFTAALDQLLGPRGGDELQLPPPATPLEKSVARHLDALAATRGHAIGEWLFQVANSPSGGVLGAQRTAESLVQYLRGLQQEARESAAGLRQEISVCEQFLCVNFPAKGRSRKSPAERDDALLRIALRRTADLSLRCLGRFLQNLELRVRAILDGLRDLRRDLSSIASQFTPLPPQEEESDPRRLGAVQSAAARALQARLEELTRELAESFSRDYLGSTGLRNFQDKPELLGGMAAALRRAARRLIRQAVGEMDIAGWLLGGTPEAATARVTACLSEADAQLLKECGGNRRLLICHGSSAGSEPLAEAIAAQTKALPQFLAGTEPDIAVCCEAENIPLARVAANYLQDRLELPELASRVRTRIDVEWLPIPDGT